MIGSMPRYAIIALAVVFATGLVACVSDSPGSGVLTVDEIVARARDAMGKVTSYRTIGEITQAHYESPVQQTAGYFTEWVAPDRFRFRLGGPPDGAGVVNEMIRIGDQTFSRDGRGEWREQPRRLPSSDNRRPGDPASFFDGQDFKLVGKELFEGVEVFRLVGTTTIENRPDGEDDSDSFFSSAETITTLLISHSDYRLVTLIAETEGRFTVLSTTNGVESRDEGWANTVTTSRFRYDGPVTIEVPTANVRLLEDNPLATPVPPPATPTAVPMLNCSDPGASWPGCGIRNAADVEVMLAVFPEDSKLTTGEDIVVTFPFDGPPAVDWQADAFIWHVPSASVVRLCVRNSAQAWQSNTPEATARFDQFLANEVMMDMVRSRMTHVEGRCVFSG